MPQPLGRRGLSLEEVQLSDCQGCSRVALENERPELGCMSPDKLAVRQESVLILETHAGELSIWRTAEDDVAGVVGVFEEGGVGVLLPKVVESLICAFTAETKMRTTARLTRVARFIGSPVEGL
jgi:hypothetical protein